MKICVGIISYLPEDDSKREVRLNRLQSLLNQLNTHFNLPILIIAQNWKDFKVNGNITVFTYDRLGITKARMILREHFLNSVYDYMIMLDDDMELSDDQAEYDAYLNFIEKTKREYYFVKNFLNNFSCISKQAFKKLTYDPNINAENGTGYEDWIFHEKCKKYLDSVEISTNLPKYERSHFLRDEYSTWGATQDVNIIKRNEVASRKIVKQIRGTVGSVPWF